MGTKFKGQFTFITELTFSFQFPFANSRICKNSNFHLSENGGSSFLSSKNNIPLQAAICRICTLKKAAALSFSMLFYFPKNFTLRNLNLKNSYFFQSADIIEKISFC